MNNRRRAGQGPVKKMKVILFIVALVGFTILSVGAKAIAPLRITDQIEVVGWEDGVDYSSQMRKCAEDGGEYAMIVGEIYEEQRNFKIDRLNLPYEKTDYFVNYQTGEEVLDMMNGGGSTKDPLQEKIERLKSEYDVAGQVYEYLNAQDMSDIVIAGILGNMMTECGGQTLDLQWSIYGYDGSYYYGLCQWSLYYNPSVDGADIVGQLDYLMSNICTNMDYFGGNYDDFCAITDPGAAAKYFCNYYERGAGASIRAANAETALAWLQAE